ncbi:MAG TPA: hypothetical protein VEV84_15215 [Pyrinomonadaceae bacterium]|nr:hypothetical protein [Pyrinomonadaceae bacterium]
MQSRDRHQAILNLIVTRPVARQDELAQLLANQGFSVTQASVSRDLEKLGVTKINGRYVRQAPNGRPSPYGPISFTEAGENLIVIKCASGLASAAAVRIDAAAIPEIVGTIAGDDTIFVAVKGAKEQSRTIKALGKILHTSGGSGEN